MKRLRLVKTQSHLFDDVIGISFVVIGIFFVVCRRMNEIRCYYALFIVLQAVKTRKKSWKDAVKLGL